MSSRSRRRSLQRSEARRRSRAVVQQDSTAPEPTDQQQPTAPSRQPQEGGFLRRAFPPAPPLPGKPDPLAGFTYAGRGRRVLAALWLLTRNPLAWIPTAAVWAFAQFTTITGDAGFGSALVSMLAFAALITAGWIGWQRPWLYGAAAAALGTVLFFTWIGLAISPEQIPEGVPTPAELIRASIPNAMLYGLVGALAGWYGGYLRRRLAAPRPDAARRR